MILVDSSVWIDLLDGRITPQTAALRRARRSVEPVGIADLVLTEVLQGTRDDTEFLKASCLLGNYIPVTVVDRRAAVQAARNYRQLRALGVTVRKTIDTLIATRCILDDIPLLYADRDFEPFRIHLGLRSALDILSE